MKIKKLAHGLVAGGCIFLFSLFTTTPHLYADTLTTPSFNLDGANTSSLAASTPTVWRDLISGTTSLTIGANSSRSSEGGGSLQISAGAGSSGAYLAPTTVGAASNPSGDITIMAWIKPTSWNSSWNIFASRWFTDFAGNGAATDQDYHFSIKSPTVNGATHFLNLFTSSKTDQYGTYDFALNNWYLVGFTLTSAGNLQFYVNGQPDGSVITGAGHTARTTTYLFVGDLRNTCTACALNGYIGKFRIWSSTLTASQIAADYRNEAANFGYQSSVALSLSNANPLYRINNTITATLTGPVSPAGKVNFYERGKIIPGCKNKSASGSTVTCAWKPSLHGTTTLSASYTPSDAQYLTSSSQRSFIVAKRTNSR